ncbi:RagB/SusD family nutrient uptake outer membrane protein [Hymenobacter baengnokdamensis]|uniref:RagB/SusD family nutrient uptake outer membrane protein n=1 Tax=Hymenobacter baengnokdamensis TaxID=2615203 RepID=UPI001247F9B3|nr:RagB/SusD family nutrient uptake outer membrane protein [Hymenobacter baengnokdamensis]
MSIFSSKSGKYGRLAASALVVAGAAGLLGSCKNYLEIEPIALNTTDATFSTAAGATSALIGTYNMLAGDAGYGNRISQYYPYDSDELIGSAGPIDGGRRSIARYKTFSTNTEITNPWNRLYQGVERANICIANLPLSPAYNGSVAADTATMHRLYGEALALRAQFYLELVRNWGDVPAQFSPTVTGQDVNLPNSDRNATLKRLIDDLAIAEKMVPWRSAAGVTNERFTKGAIKALRARIAMQRGGYALHGLVMTRPTDYLDYYKIARQECLDIMNHRSEHTLNSSFLETFKSINELRTEAANELMMTVGMGGSGSASDSKLGYYDGPRLSASPTFGSSSGAITIAPPYFYAFDSTDVRRDVTITLYTISNTNAYAATTLANGTDGKFRREWRVPALPGTSNYLGYSWPLIRFADVELLFAEAENELNGPTADAQKALLEVRTRAFAGNAAKAAAGLTLTSKDAFFNALVNERYLEFGGEGIRKYDLLRWNLFTSKLADVKAKIAQMQAGTVPYGPSQITVTIPATIYFKPVTGGLQFARSFYAAAPATAPAGTTSASWGASITTSYVANTQPSGSSYMGSPSTGTGLAAEYVPSAGKELLPIPQSTIDVDPALTQNSGY